MNCTDPLVYNCAPSVTWVKDRNWVIIVDEEGERWWSLEGVEAAIWDLLTLKYSFNRMVDLLAVLLGGSKERAAETLLATMRYWDEEGIVAAEGGSRNGCPRNK